MKRIIIVVLCAVLINSLILGCEVKKRVTPKPELSRKEMINAAIKKAKEINYNIKKMKIIFDEGNERWGRSSYREPPVLMGRNYQAIYFFPKFAPEHSLEVGIYFFVDKNTGEVIYYLEEPN